MKLSIVDSLPLSLRQNAVVLKIQSGERLFRKGDRSECTYLIQEGRFQEICYPEIGKIAVLQILQAGEVLGESSIQTQVYHSTAIAQTEARVIAYPNYILREALSSSSFTVDAVLNILTQKIDELQIRLEWRNISVADRRVWSYLKHKLEKVSAASDSNQTLTLDAPLQEIAAELGFVPSTLSRALAKLEAERKITRSQNRITLHDVA